MLAKMGIRLNKDIRYLSNSEWFQNGFRMISELGILTTNHCNKGEDARARHSEIVASLELVSNS